MINSVKTERQDDAEILQLAEKIKEQNRAKTNQMAYPGGVPPSGMHPNQMHMNMARPGQPMISNYMHGRNGAAPVNSANNNGAAGATENIDSESRRGRFGWCEFEKNFIPYIFRNVQERYTSVRMVERKFLSKFLAVLPPEVNSCHCIRSYYITDAESKLLNEINLKHNDGFFGKEAFTTKDLVVRLSDAKEFYKFLDLCHKKLVLKKSNASDRCGFFRINGESVVPYTMRDTVKFVPLFYFEGETDHLKLKSDSVDGWDLAYLKFCCKVQGIRNELFSADTCKVVALDEIKVHFPQGTTFEDYWPAKGSIEPVVTTQRNPAGNWTQRPPGGTVPVSSHTTPAQPYNTSRSSYSHQSASRTNSSSSHHSSTSTTSSSVAQAQAAQAAALAAQQSLAYSYLTAQVQAQAQQQAAAQQAQQQASQYLNNPQYRQLLQSATAAGQMNNYAAIMSAMTSQASTMQQQQLAQQLALLQQQQAAAQQQQQASSASSSSTSASSRHHGSTNDKAFPGGKLTQIKEFPIEKSNQPPYKLQKAFICEKLVPSINVRPFVFNDLMMTLPDFVKHFCPHYNHEKAWKMLHDTLHVVVYKGNKGHQEVLRSGGKCSEYDPVPLILVKDIMQFKEQIKYMVNSNSVDHPPSSKRSRLD